MKLRSDRLALELARARGPFAIVCFLLVCATIAGWAILRNVQDQWPWEDTTKVRVAVDSAKGILPKHHQVRIAGVPVGQVAEAEVEGKQAILTLSLEADAGPVFRDARVRLRPVTPLQDMYVAIESRGTPRAGRLGSDEVLPTGQTTSPVDISRVLNTFDADTRTRLTELLAGMGKGLDGRGEQLREAFVALAPFLRTADRLTGAMAERRRAIARVVHNLGGLTEALNRRDDQLTSLVSVGNGTLGELASHDDTLSSTLAQLPPTFTSMRANFAELRAAQTELDPALRALEPVAERMEPGMDALKDVSDDATPALKRLGPAFTSLRPFADDLAPSSRALRDAFARLQPAMPRLDQVTRRIVPCRTPLAKLLHWGISVDKLHDTAGALQRGQLILGLDSATGGLAKDPSLRKAWSCTEGGPSK